MNSPRMANASSYSRDLWAPLLGLSAQEVFSLMLASELVVPPEPFSEPRFNVTSMVGLAGSLCGLITLRCDDTSARLMASKMLGTEVNSGDQELFDAIGEISNMVAGNFKNKLSGIGEGCQLSLPTVITGEDYSCHAIANDCTIECAFLFEGLPLAFSLRINS